MAEFLYASSHLAGDFPNPANAVGNTPGTWAGVLDQNTSYTSRWAIGDPVDPLTATATQTIRIVARKGANSGIPTIAINLYENGVLVGTILAATNITSTSSQTLVATFNSSQVSDRTLVEIEVVMTGAGGNPNTRNSAQISHIEWEADTTVAAEPVDTVSASLPVEVDLNGSVVTPIALVPQLAGPINVEVDLAGVVAAPSETVESVAASLPVEVNLQGVAETPAASIDDISAPLPVDVGMIGTLDQPTATVSTVDSSLDVLVDLSGILADPGVVAVDSVTASLPVETSLSGTLDTPTATVPELAGSLGVEADLGGVLVGKVTARLRSRKGASAAMTASSPARARVTTSELTADSPVSVATADPSVGKSTTT